MSRTTMTPHTKVLVVRTILDIRKMIVPLAAGLGFAAAAWNGGLWW